MMNIAGSGGRLGAKGATLSQYVAQQLVKRKPDMWDQDPRGAILRHAEEAKNNPFWVAPAYKKYVHLYMSKVTNIIWVMTW